MKKTSKILIVTVISLFLLFSMMVPAFAGTGTITITNSNEAVSMNGHTYKAYKLFDVTYDSVANTYDYTIATEFVPYFTSLSLDASLGEDLDARAYSFVSSKTGDAELQSFAKNLYDNYIDTNSIAHAGQVVSSSATTATITGLDNGYYLVYDAGNAAAGNNAEKAIANIALTTAAPDATIVLKASVPTIDKKATAVTDAATNDASATGNNGISAVIGKHVGFQIDSIVPDLTNYTNYTYKVTDTMSAGLLPDQNVKVMIGTDDVTAQSTIEYNGQKTTITIPYAVLSNGYVKDTPITITYSATVTPDAVVYAGSQSQYSSNDATLQYSNNVDDLTSTETTPSETVKVYLYSIDITKVNDKNVKLQGAEFTLKDNAGNFIPVSLSGGRYKVSDTLAATAANATVTSDANGKVYIDGLAEGTYTLTETKAPATYNLLKNPVSITITATYNADGTVASVAGNTATVVNKAGGILPSTGGIGTVIFTVCGIVVMLGAVLLLTFKKREKVK